MRRATAILAAALITGHAALALAQEQTFFGPKSYDHPEGGTSSSVDTVVVPPYIAGPFTMQVQNGTAGDERSQVEAAWIFLNDQQVASPEDFHPHIAQFGRTVQMLPQQNRLVIIVRGRPRTQLAVSFSGQLVPPQVVSLTPVNTTLTLGGSTKLQLAISPAQPTDTTVALENSPPGVASVPATVTVPAGQTVADVPVGSVGFGQAGITARLNGSQASALVTVIPQSLQVTSIVPAAARLNVRATSTFTVNINAVQDQDKPIALSVDVADVLEALPASVIVPAGSTSASFTATGKTVGDVVITASANGTQATASAHVSPEPAAIESLTPSPLALQPGAISNLKVTINVAQESDTLVSVANDAPGVAAVPDSVTIPAGAVQALIGVTAATVGTANVTASVNGTSATASVDVSLPAPVVTSVTPATFTLANGRSATMTVNISRALSVLTVVTLVSTDMSIASVPPVVNIPAGATSADFPVAMNAEGQATIGATLNNVSASATVTVAPAELLSLTITPPTPTITVGQTQQFNATGKMTAGPDQDFTGRVTWGTSDATAGIDANGMATAVAPGNPTVTATFTYIPAGSTLPVTVSQSTTLTILPPAPPPPSLTISGQTVANVGVTATGTVFSSQPAPANGLLVSLTITGGPFNGPTGALMPPGATSVNFGFQPLATGQYTVTATFPGFQPATLTVTVLPSPLSITSIAPASGTPGTLIVISGGPFDPVPSNNAVSFTPGLFAPVLSGTTTQLAVNVPTGAVTGPITVNVPGVGQAQSVPFVVVPPAQGSLSLSLPNPLPSGQNGGGQVISSVPAPTAGLLVTLTVTGPAPLTIPPTVTIPAGATLASFQFVASVPGTYQITASAPNETPAVFTLTVTQGLVVTSVSPTTGAPGTVVTITGGPFDPVLANDTVVFQPGVFAPIVSATPTQLVITVPNGAITGPITVNVLGFGPVNAGVFTLPPPPTHAHLTDVVGKPSSPVTPFVQGSNPGDTIQVLVTGTALNGTATAVGSQLAYTGTTLPPIGADQFTYRVVKSDGSTLDATARARVYPASGANSLITCTRNSIINAGALNRTNAAPCAFYAEATPRVTPSGATVTVKYLVARPSSGAAPKAAVFLIGGADLDMSITGNAANGVPSGAGGNFLVRTMQLFADAGYLAVAMQRPTDLPPPGSADPLADIDQYRISVKHAVDILAVMREENADDLPLFIAGTSRGAMSVVASNLVATGVSISSPVTRGSPGDPALVFVNDPRYPSLQPSFVQRPTHVLWNTSDLCSLTQPADSQALFNNLLAAGVTAASSAVTGGFAFDNGTGIDQCGGLSPHQFLGIEKTASTVPLGAATAVTAWLDSRVAALGGDRHPDASFATLSTAGGAPLSIDLSTLARDPDGDPLAYALSHTSTALGGSVSISGSTVAYTPPAGVASGSDYFVYVVTDGRGGVGAAVITVKIGG